MRKKLFQQKYIKCEVSHTGNCGNVNLWFFSVNYAMICSFAISKTVNLMVFYSKITL